MVCGCESCLAVINAPEPVDTWLSSLRKSLAEGTVIHIGNAPDGRPIYRAN
jgi:hypothetical protein